MKKRIIACSILLCMALLTGGCTAGNTSSGDTPETQQVSTAENEQNDENSREDGNGQSEDSMQRADADQRDHEYGTQELMAERAVEVYPSSELKVISGAGHVFSGDNGTLAVEYILDYLDSHLWNVEGRQGRIWRSSMMISTTRPWCR